MNDIPEKDLDYIKRLAGKVYVKSFVGVEYDDLLQEGVLAYLKLRQKYDEKKNDFYMGFAYKRVYGAMLDWVGKQAYNKGKAVRKTIKEPDYKIVPAPENLEAYAVDGNKEIEKDFIKEDISKIIRENFTIFEITLLEGYFKDTSKCFSNFKQFFGRKKDMMLLIENILVEIRDIYEIY